jgi:ATP-dependent RNA helicase DeaD
VTSKFRSGRIQILVATDVVSRGLDFSKVSHVFIYQLPGDAEVYVHRSGRTGRYDKTGVVVSLITARELSLLKPILKQIKQEAKWIKHPPAAVQTAKIARPFAQSKRRLPKT